MFTSIEELKKHPVFRFFAEISAIPRSSGNEKAISDYLVRFAKEQHLEVIQDEALNVIIKKPASKGYEHKPTVILQGHMDMVCEKNEETVHDFRKDPIRLRIVEDMLYATNTTLGADNGIAAAYALALLDANDVMHPPLEIVITTEEETTMKGAHSVDPSLFTGTVFINLDSEEEGTLLVSCAGGVTGRISIPIVLEEASERLHPYRITIRGLKGGHSGMAIHKGRGNANKLMGRVLHDLSSSTLYRLHTLHGGLKTNAIPREASAVILLEDSHSSKLQSEVKKWNEILSTELRVSDPDVEVMVERLNNRIQTVFSKQTTEKVISALMLIPNGVQTMSMDIEGLVESSTNLGVVTTLDHEVKLENEIRSSVKSLKMNIVNQLNVITHALGGEFTTDSDYPEWGYNASSTIRPLFEKTYKEMFGKEAKVMGIHAGLECGVFAEKIPDLDAISLGPDMFDVHTPNEHLSIPSTIRIWDYLLAVLKAM